jgi:hypothetical protein
MLDEAISPIRIVRRNPRNNLNYIQIGKGNKIEFNPSLHRLVIESKEQDKLKRCGRKLAKRTVDKVFDSVIKKNEERNKTNNV